MKKILLSAALIAASFTTVAQVGVGTTAPKGALQVTSTTSGVIIPQFADLIAIQAIKKADGTTALNADEQGMQVYNIAEKKNYMWNGTAWVALNSSKFVDGTTITDAVFVEGKVGMGIATPAWEAHLYDDDGTAGFLLSQTDNSTTFWGDNVGIGLMTHQGTVAGVGNPSNKAWQIVGYGNDYANEAPDSDLMEFQNDLIFSFYNLGSKKDILTLEHDTGFVGIGTHTPSSNLEISSTTSDLKLSSTSRSSIQFDNDSRQIDIRLRGDNLFTFQDIDNGSNPITITSNGNVGINSITASTALHVNGYIKVASSDVIGDANPVVGMIRYNNGLQYHNGTVWNTLGGVTNSKWTNDTANTRVELTNLSDGITARTGKEFLVHDNGNVSIGTINSDAKLSVNGSIKISSTASTGVEGMIQYSSTDPNGGAITGNHFWGYNGTVWIQLD
jgi:hypothetical protein